MKKILILFSALLLQAVAATVFAQNSNTVISGIVLDEVTNEPITGARVMETDENFDSVYSFLSTDVNGRFSFTLHETDNVLRVSYADYQSVKMPLDKTAFEIKLKKGGSVSGRFDGAILQLGGGNLNDGFSPMDFVNNVKASDVRVLKVGEEYGGDGRASAEPAIIKGRVMEDDNTHVYNVRITERDANDRIISYAISNPYGNYTISVTDPENYICFERFAFKELRCRASELNELVYIERIGKRPMIEPEMPQLKYANPRLDDDFIEGYRKSGNADLIRKVERQESAITVDGFHYLLDDNGHASVCYMFWKEAQGDVVIPESINYQGRKYTVTAIDGSAFWNCVNMTSVSIPKTVVTIGSCAFESCIRLKSVVIPQGVKTIEPCAFNDCSSLKSIFIAGSVESIGEFAFAGCPLEIISLDSANLIDCPEDAFDLRLFFNAMLNVPKNWERSNGNAGVWRQFRKIEHLDIAYDVK
ncbi:MAG: leucine-rich repeat protein [Treponema sp.]|nr:leucine-rich repeat protein [Treponema sp.]